VFKSHIVPFPKDSYTSAALNCVSGSGLGVCQHMPGQKYEDALRWKFGDHFSFCHGL
jgi:hypothetical protein